MSIGRYYMTVLSIMALRHAEGKHAEGKHAEGKHAEGKHAEGKHAGLPLQAKQYREINEYLLQEIRIYFRSFSQVDSTLFLSSVHSYHALEIKLNCALSNNESCPYIACRFPPIPNRHQNPGLDKNRNLS